jgi:hypothetical protein
VEGWSAPRGPPAAHQQSGYPPKIIVGIRPPIRTRIREEFGPALLFGGGVRPSRRLSTAELGSADGRRLRPRLPCGGFRECDQGSRREKEFQQPHHDRMQRRSATFAAESPPAGAFPAVTGSSPVGVRSWERNFRILCEQGGGRLLPGARGRQKFSSRPPDGQGIFRSYRWDGLKCSGGRPTQSRKNHQPPADQIHVSPPEGRAGKSTARSRQRGERPSGRCGDASGGPTPHGRRVRAHKPLPGKDLARLPQCGCVLYRVAFDQHAVGGVVALRPHGGEAASRQIAGVFWGRPAQQPQQNGLDDSDRAAGASGRHFPDRRHPCPAEGSAW